MPRTTAHRTPSVRRAATLLGVLAAAALVAGCTAAPSTAPQGTGPDYVALGDSSAAGPLTGALVGPLGCTRSDANSAHLLAEALDARTFVDVSCGNATLDHLAQPQATDVLGIPLGTVPPQLDAVSADTDLVTLAMGGNDVLLPNVATSCINLTTVPLGPPPLGQSCIPRFVVDGVDTVSLLIGQARTEYLAAVAELRRRAPRARIVLVNYMAAAPPGDTGCFPDVPVLDQDLVWLRTKLEELNAMIADVARESGVELVDLYGPSVGHDMCQGPGDRWMNALSWDSPGILLHANRLGHAAFAGIIADAVRSGAPGPG